MTKDEMKDKISMALKDPILQQGFEIICKNLAELEKENAELEKENAELKEQVENKFLKEQCLILADGNVCNSTCSEIKKQLTKAKEIIKDFILMAKVEHLKDRYETVDEAEQFLNSEVE